MEKASTPRNRLTRSAAKQVNTPKNIDQDEGHSLNEDMKQHVRKTRRKTEAKPNTNGDTSSSSPKPPVNMVENAISKSNEVNDVNSLDSCDSENSNISAKQTRTPKLSNNKTPPIISRKSLRPRRSITPGPELESSASKKLKRTTSEGKLESLSTPTRRRSMRANSESKDFKLNCEKLSSISESNSRFTHRNPTSRITIDKIVEANEVEDSNDDEPLTSLIDYSKHNKENTVEDLSCKKFSEEVNDSTEAEVDSKNATDKNIPDDSYSEESKKLEVEEETSQEQEEVCDKITSNTVETTVDRIPNKQENQNPTVPDIPDNKTNVDNHEDEENVVGEMCLEVSFSEDTNEPNVQKLETSSTAKNVYQDICKESKANNVTEDENERCDSDSIEIDIIAVDNNSQDMPLKPSVESKVCHNKSISSEKSIESSPALLIESGNLADNDDAKKSLKYTQSKTNILFSQNDEVISDSQEINKSLECHTPVKDMKVEDQSITTISDKTCPRESDNVNVISQIDNATSHNEDMEKSNVVNEGEAVSDVNFEKVDPIEINETSKEKNEYVQNDCDTVNNVNLDKQGSIEIKETHIPYKSIKEDNEKILFESPGIVSKLQNNDIADTVLIDESEDSENQLAESIKEDNENIPLQSPRIVPELQNNDIADTVFIDESEDSENQLAESINEVNEKIPLESSGIVSKLRNDKIAYTALIDEGEDSPNEKNSKNDLSYEIDEINKPEICNIKIKNIHIIAETENIQSNVNENPELHAQNLIGKEQYVIDEINETTEEIMEVIEREELDEDAEDINATEPNEIDETAILESSVKSAKNDDELNIDTKNTHFIEGEQYEGNINNDKDEDYENNKNYKDLNNFDEDNFNDGENKIEDSESDIYQGMSDFGTDGDEQKDGSQFNESQSSELQSGESEEYISSVEEEEVKEEEGSNKNDHINSDKKTEQSERKSNILSEMKQAEKPFDSNNPITYDAALAILNKNRAKKIDDEEFFDMFTQELNRVSEESGSDSDIAIVDEYLMEPEEPTSKPNKKPTIPQGNSNPIQCQKFVRPVNSMARQGVLPPGHFYNQPIPSQHNLPHSNYHHYNQNMSTRGPGMYNQFLPPNQPMPDPGMFNAQVPPDVNFSSAVYKQHEGPTQLCYTNSPMLKVRSVNVMNSAQSFNEMNAGLQPEASSVLENTPREHGENSGNFRCAATMTETENVRNISVRSPKRKITKKSPSTPILNLLELDKPMLKQLKQVLGISKKSRISKTSLKPKDLVNSLLIKPKVDKIHKRRRRARRVRKHSNQSQMKDLNKLEVKQTIDSDSATDTRLKGPCNVRSSDEASTSSNQEVFQLNSRNDRMSSLSSSDSTSSRTERLNRKVNVKAGKIMTITLDNDNRAKKYRHRMKKGNDETSSEISTKLKKKYKSTISLDEKIRAGGKKMTQTKKENKKKPTLLKSNCGTFTVDGATTANSGSSDTEELSQEELPSPPRVDLYLQELEKIKQIAKSDKNKLSNLFRHPQVSKESREMKASGRENVTKKPKRNTVKKLPKAVLDLLSSDEISSPKRQRSVSPESDESVTVSKKKRRKTAKKLHVKSGVSGESYIPCVTAGATQFGLSRLDKVTAHTLKAAQFRSDQLYGGSVKRITTAELMKTKNKQKFNETSQKKKKRALVLAPKSESE